MKRRAVTKSLRRQHTWTNWMGNLSCSPEIFAEPDSLEALQEVVRRAYQQGRQIRPVGTGHAWTPQVTTEDCLISTRRLNRVLGVEGQVMHIEAGMTVRRLLDHSERAGLAVTGASIFKDISVAGLASTGSHGTGLKYGCFADGIVGMTLVNVKGERVELDTSTPDLLRAARVSLGTLGIIYSIKLRCEPDFRLTSRHLEVPLEQMLSSIQQLPYEHDHVSLYWHPFTDKAWLHLSDRTEKPMRFPWYSKALVSLECHVVQGAWAPMVMDQVLRRWPALTPRFMALSMLSKRRYEYTWKSRHAFHYLEAIPRVWLGANVVPIEHSRATFAWIIQHVRDAAKEGQFPVNIAVHARFVRKSDAHLAMTQGRDCCCIEVVSLEHAVGMRPFFRGLQEDLTREFDGRPHWGKLFHVPPTFRALYPETFDDFCAIRKDFDPEGRLLTPFLAGIFAPSSVHQAGGDPEQEQSDWSSSLVA